MLIIIECLFVEQLGGITLGIVMDVDPVLEPHPPLPPCLPLVLPVVPTYMWLNNLGTITQAHYYNQTSLDICDELWVDFPPGNQLYPSTDSSG